MVNRAWGEEGEEGKRGGSKRCSGIIISSVYNNKICLQSFFFPLL